MKKVIICIIFLIILSGCTIKDNVIVNYNGSVKEEVHVLQKNDIIGNNLKSMVDNKISQNKLVLDYKKYNYNYEKGSELSGAVIYKNYDNICSYFENSAFNQYVYKYMDCNLNNGYYEIKNDTEYIPYCPECSDWPALEKITYKISLPIPAEEQNADEINGNTYTWNYDKDTTNKNFYLKISKSKLEDYKSNYIKNKKQKENNKKYIIIGIGIAVLFVILIGSIALYIRHKRNSIDY